ncbi:hypothetical protein MMC25_004230 [Agyrium rufum]|nr:hypothetical protein [Agyrium rufum]
MQSSERNVYISLKHAEAKPPVFVAGAFTNPPWEPRELKHRAVDNSEEYEFVASFPAKEGQYQYKFRIGTGDWWICDQSAQQVQDDAGNWNNVLDHKWETPSKPKKHDVRQHFTGGSETRQNQTNSGEATREGDEHKKLAWNFIGIDPAQLVTRPEDGDTDVQSPHRENCPLIEHFNFDESLRTSIASTPCVCKDPTSSAHPDNQVPTSTLPKAPKRRPSPMVLPISHGSGSSFTRSCSSISSVIAQTEENNEQSPTFQRIDGLNSHGEMSSRPTTTRKLSRVEINTIRRIISCPESAEHAEVSDPSHLSRDKHSNAPLFPHECISCPPELDEHQGHSSRTSVSTLPLLTPRGTTSMPEISIDVDDYSDPVYSLTKKGEPVLKKIATMAVDSEANDQQSLGDDELHHALILPSNALKHSPTFQHEIPKGHRQKSKHARESISIPCGEPSVPLL